MKAEAKPVIAIVGLLTVGLFGFALVQVVPLMSVSNQPNVRAKLNSNNSHPSNQVKEEEMPAVTTDPFRTLEAPINATIPSAGVQTGTSQSMPVSGSIGPATAIEPSGESLPEVEPNQATNENSPNGQSAAPQNLGICFRGVIIADRTEAYLSVHGKSAKPYALGSEVLPGITLFNIQTNFIELKSGDEIIRLRVGQEVQL